MPLRKPYRGTDLVIPNAGTDSNEVTKLAFGGARGFAIQGPATLPETCTVQVSLDGGVTFGDLTIDGTAVTVGAGAVVAVDTVMAWDGLRIQASAAVGADRTFFVQYLRDY